MNTFKKLYIICCSIVPLVIYLNRFLIPDYSFDSLNYHLFLGARSWDLLSATKYEFIPMGLFNFNPLSDLLPYLFRQLLGYRLGTIYFLILFYLSIYVCKSILKLFGVLINHKSSWFVIFPFTLLFFLYEPLFQLATYYTDIQTTFLVLLSIYCLVKAFITNDIKFLYLSSLMFGFSFVSKMTSIYYFIPSIFIIFAFYFKSCNIVKLISRILINIFVFFIPSVFFIADNYSKTGNPFFPFFNAFFKSEYFPLVDFKQTLFGGKFLIEKLFWFAYSTISPTRLGEARELFHDYKFNILGLIFFTSVILYLFVKHFRKNMMGNVLILYVVFCYLFWSFSVGYLRYGIIIEILLIIWIIFFINKVIIYQSRTINFYFKLFLSILYVILLIFSLKLFKFNLLHDISWRPGLYTNPDYKNELGNLFNDNSNLALPAVNYLLMCDYSTSGYFTYYPNIIDKPLINIEDIASSGITINYKYIEKVSGLLSKYKINNNTFSPIYISISSADESSVSKCIKQLNKYGYTILKTYEDFYYTYHGKPIKIFILKK